ncbi:MAG TPA: hypothetical protein VNH22_19550 [Blastocatellia bacterium]|jgi:hypothetical protein|nr:hypothetical protein [Blastocatellia bacterium]
MTDKHKAKIQQDATRLIDWLKEHREEFEQNGVDEASLRSSVGLSEDEIREAVDYLENHEDVVRRPQALTTPPRFLLTPGRGWPDIAREESRAQ